MSQELDPLFWQDLAVSPSQRAARLGQRPLALWFTGLSGAGKTSIANAVEQRLHQLGHATYLLDGDNIRHGLSAGLGFSLADRAENVRRVGEVARLMVDAGLIVLVSLISPELRHRQAVRERFKHGDFHECFVSTPLHECERRDPKGLYRLARAGQLSPFTGITSPYEPPMRPELTLNTVDSPLLDCVQQVIDYVIRHQ